MRKDLVALVADKDMEFALRGLFSRSESLDIRSINVDIRTHPERDPGCAFRGVRFLSNLSRQYEYGLLMFDYEGSGRNKKLSREELQNEINMEFTQSPWGNKARAIVLAPELEVWVWSDSPEVAEIAGWKGRRPSLRDWLIEHGELDEGQKPKNPKETFQEALRKARKQRSPSLYQQLAERVSLRRCRDEAFGEFKDIMRGWFAVD